MLQYNVNLVWGLFFALMFVNVENLGVLKIVVKPKYFLPIFKL